MNYSKIRNKITHFPVLNLKVHTLNDLLLSFVNFLKVLQIIDTLQFSNLLINLLKFFFLFSEILHFRHQIWGTWCYNGVVSDHGSDFFCQLFHNTLAINVGLFILFEYLELMNQLIDLLMILEFLTDGLLLRVAFLNVLNVKIKSWNWRFQVDFFFLELSQTIFLLNDEINLGDQSLFVVELIFKISEKSNVINLWAWTLLSRSCTMLKVFQVIDLFFEPVDLKVHFNSLCFSDVMVVALIVDLG